MLSARNLNPCWDYQEYYNSDALILSVKSCSAWLSEYLHSWLILALQGTCPWFKSISHVYVSFSLKTAWENIVFFRYESIYFWEWRFEMVPSRDVHIFLHISYSSLGIFTAAYCCNSPMLRNTEKLTWKEVFTSNLQLEIQTPARMDQEQSNLSIIRRCGIRRNALSGIICTPHTLHFPSFAGYAG